MHAYKKFVLMKSPLIMTIILISPLTDQTVASSVLLMSTSSSVHSVPTVSSAVSPAVSSAMSPTIFDTALATVSIILPTASATGAGKLK